MDENLGSSTSKNILRWLLFLPTAILVFLIPFYFFTFFTRFMLEQGYYISEDFYSPSSPISFLCIYFFTFFSSFFLFVHTGSFVVPSNKRTVAIILSLVLIAPLVFYFYVTNFVTGAFDSLLLESLAYLNYAMLFGIIGIVVANLTIKIEGLSKYTMFFLTFLILVFGGLYFFNTRDNFISDEDFVDIERRVQACQLEENVESYLQNDRSNPTKCYARVAIELNNYSICEELGNKERLFVPGWVPFCYAEIAVTKQDKKVCDLIDNSKFPGYQEQCRGFVEAGQMGNFLHVDPL